MRSPKAFRSSCAVVVAGMLAASLATAVFSTAPAGAQTAHPTSCTRVVRGTPSSVDVGPNELVCVDRAVISGDVTSHQGGGLVMTNSVVNGSVESGANEMNTPFLLVLCRNTIGGFLTSYSNSGPVVVGLESQGCGGNTIRGGCGCEDAAFISNTQGALYFERNTVGTNYRTNNSNIIAEFSYNTGSFSFAANTFRGNVNCFYNAQVPTNGGRGNTINGGGIGQCAGL